VCHHRQLPTCSKLLSLAALPSVRMLASTAAFTALFLHSVCSSRGSPLQ
jgi:hypothetical protein